MYGLQSTKWNHYLLGRQNIFHRIQLFWLQTDVHTICLLSSQQINLVKSTQLHFAYKLAPLVIKHTAYKGCNKHIIGDLSTDFAYSFGSRLLLCTSFNNVSVSGSKQCSRSNTLSLFFKYLQNFKRAALENRTEPKL